MRWLLDEVSGWDESLASAAARRAISEYYGRLERTLAAALSPPPPVPPRPTPVHLTPLAEAAAAPALAPPPSPIGFRPRPTPAGEEVGAEAVVQPAPPPTPEPLPAAPPRPSRWATTWKPLLHESIGWFLGAFLILSGALYLVADAWRGMASSGRALTVFGLTEGWAVGFALWALALSRKPQTRTAATSLFRIGALIAPLATLSLGPALESPLTWLSLVLGSGVAAALALRVAKDLEEPDAALLAASFGLGTLGLGLAPVLPGWGGWLLLVPTGLGVLALRRGPRATVGATWWGLLAFCVPVAGLGLRFLLTGPLQGSALAAACVAVAALSAATLELRTTPRADALAVLALSVLLVSFGASFLVAAPACVLVACLGAWSTARLARGEEPRSPWWLAGTYGFAYLAWQRVDQLVPAVVWQWWELLKASLGYAAAPLPVSYGSVFQALFVGVGAAVAGWRWLRGDKRSALLHVWLRCSAVAAVAAGALAMVSVTADARPALVSLPVLLAPLLVVGLVAGRRDAVGAGSVLAVLFALSAGLAFPPGLGAGCCALLLALGAHALPRERRLQWSRRWLAFAGLASGAAALLLAAPQPGLGATTTLLLGAVACVLAARALSRQLLGLASFAALAPLVHLGSPLLFALAALGGAALLLKPRSARWRAAMPAIATAALLAAAWSVPSPASLPLGPALALGAAVGTGFVPWRRARWLLALAAGLLLLWLVPAVSLPLARGVPFLVCAGALGALALRTRHAVWLQLPALACLVLSLAAPFGLWAGWGEVHALVGSGALALCAAVHAARRGRSVPGVWAASLACVAALGTVLGGTPFQVAAALVVLVATPALLPSLTVPLAAAVLAAALWSTPLALPLLAVAAAAVGLLEESDWTWRQLLNRASVRWAAVISSALLLVLALSADLGGWLGAPLSVLLPLVWARATRRGELASLAVPFAAVAGAWWWAPALALLLGRGLAFVPVRQLLGAPARGDTEQVLHFCIAAAVAAWDVFHAPGHALAWAPVLVGLGGPVPALRVAAAAAVAFASEPLRGPAVGSLLALAAAAEHLPLHLRALLGTRVRAAVKSTSVLLAVLGAAVLAVTGRESAPALGLLLLVAAVLATSATALVRSGRRRFARLVACVTLGAAAACLSPEWALPLTMLAAAVLLDLPWLLLGAALTAVVELPATLTAEAPVLASQAVPVALLAGLAAFAARRPSVARWPARAWHWLGRTGDQPELSSPLYFSALAVAVVLLFQADVRVLWLLPVVVLTPRRLEAALGISVALVATWLHLPQPTAVPLICAGALGLAWAGTHFAQLRVSQVWRHAAWVCSLAGIASVGPALGSPLFVLAWAAAAGTAWLLLREAGATARGWAWAATGLAAHLVMASVGVALSTGAPKVLIFPWWAAASAGLALLRHLRGGRASVWCFGALGVTELLAGSLLLFSSHPREAVLSVLVAGVLAFVSWRRVVALDEAVSAWLGQVAVVGGALAARVLGQGAMPSLTDAWLLLGVSAMLAGLAQLLGREGRGAAARALRVGAWGWPLFGALLVPWHDWSHSGGWLVGLALLAAWWARSGQRVLGALLSALALNAAVLVVALGSGMSALQWVLVPLGGSVLVLGQLFSAELQPAALARVRAWGVGLLYAAVAWTPLTVTSLPALALCVGLCLFGVVLGARWRVRSFVVLGSGVLVATVLATLVRSGLAEPRLGAVFLSLLGLGVVVVMVVLTTRREALQAQLASVQRAMASWEG